MSDHNLNSIWNTLSDWSQDTFGTDLEHGPIGALKHLKHEADEAIEKPDDLMEYSDCLILVLDACRRAGYNLKELLDNTALKLEINKRRVYPKPIGDNPSFHVK